MTDFEDEPGKARGADDDIWDDEPAPAPARSARRKPVDDDWDDDWDDEAPRSGRRDLTLVYAVLAAAVVIVLAVVLTRPKDDNGDSGTTAADGATTTAIQKNWQGPVGADVGEGASQVQSRIAAEDGVFIWTDFEGWHVRSKSPQEVTVVVRAETVTDKATGGDPKAEVTVVLPAGGDGSTGADLDLGGSESATFEITSAGALVAAEQIKLGGGDAVADANPVTFTKA